MHRNSFLLLLLLISSFSLSAQEREGSSGDTTQQRLVVGLSEHPPFTMRSEEGLWDGISVDLWRQTADKLDLVFEFREAPKDSLLRLMERGELDVAIGLTADPGAEGTIDFSTVYYMSQMGVASSSSQSLSSIAKGIFTMQFLEIAIWISSLLLVVGVLIWVVERRANKEHFGGERSIWSGIGSGFWWAGVTMTTIGYGDKAPITFLGRALALLWMLIAMAVTASLTAAIISAVGLDNEGMINTVDDLRGRKIGVLKDSRNAAYLQQERIQFTEFPTLADGLRILQDDDSEIDIFVDDAASLRYVINEHTDLELSVETVQLSHQFHAFAFQEGFQQQEDVNRTILQIINDPAFSSLLNRYIPNPQAQ